MYAVLCIFETGGLSNLGESSPLTFCEAHSYKRGEVQLLDPQPLGQFFRAIFPSPSRHWLVSSPLFFYSVFNLRTNSSFQLDFIFYIRTFINDFFPSRNYYFPAYSLPYVRHFTYSRCALLLSLLLLSSPLLVPRSLPPLHPMPNAKHRQPHLPPRLRRLLLCRWTPQVPHLA